MTIVVFNLRTLSAVPRARAGLLAAAPPGAGQGLAAVLAGLAPLLLGRGRRQRARVLERGRRPAQVHSSADCTLYEESSSYLGGRGSSTLPRLLTSMRQGAGAGGGAASGLQS